MSLIESSSQAGGEEKFVRIFDPIAKKPVGFLLSSDSTLPINKLAYRFPGVLSLEYKNGEDGLDISVDFDHAKKAFVAPPGGWQGKTFNLVFKEPKKADVPYNGNVEGPLPLDTEMAKYSFYIDRDDVLKSCAVLITSEYLATYLHSTSINFEIGKTINVCSSDGTKYEATVMDKLRRLDAVLLKLKSKITFEINFCKKECKGVLIKLHGRGNKDNELCFREGISSRNIAFKDTGPFVLAKLHSGQGDSGGAVFDHCGLYGMCIAYYPFTLREDTKKDTNTMLDKKTTLEEIERAGSHEVTTVIVPARDLIACVKEIEDKLSPPTKKYKPCEDDDGGGFFMFGNKKLSPLSYD